jgi:hypothetical protein
MKDGYFALEILKNIFKDEQRLRHFYSMARNIGLASEYVYLGEKINLTIPMEIEMGRLKLLHELIEAGFIQIANDQPIMDTHMRETLMHFLGVLRNTIQMKDERILAGEGKHQP